MHLKHFGILGMKWGVRRYQNPDGTLTSQGKKRYSVKNETDDSFTLEKGSTIYRIANKDEDLSTGKEKYYSVTEADRSSYRELLDAGGLFLDRSKSYGEFINTTEADLKIKKGEAVVQDLIDQYGGVSAKELSSHFENQKRLRKEMPNRNDRDAYISLNEDALDFEKQLEDSASYKKVNDFVWDVMKKHGNKVIKDYKDKGYDGIVDPFDFVANVSDMPIIVANPNGRISQKSYDPLSYD